MNPIAWRLTHVLSRLLASDERAAVMGDLAECEASGFQALLDVADLIARRQLQPWKELRTWVATIGLALAGAVSLSLSSFSLGGRYDLYFWIARNRSTIDPTILNEIGLTLRPGLTRLLLSSLFLACWAWTSGFVLASLSRRAVRVNGALFFLVIAGIVVTSLSSGGAYQYVVDEGMFPLAFYTVVFPLILQVCLVLLPLVGGIREALVEPPRFFVVAVIWTVAITTLLLLRDWYFWPFHFRDALIYLAYWPFVYIPVNAVQHLWPERRTA